MTNLKEVKDDLKKHAYVYYELTNRQALSLKEAGYSVILTPDPFQQDKSPCYRITKR